jgi:membrane protein
MAMNFIERWRHQIFDVEISEHGLLGRTVVFSIRLAVGIVGLFRDEKLHLQSTSLAYTTLLSFVPFLAVTFSVLKGLGVQNQLEPILMRSLEPLGEKGVEIGQYILTYVSNLNFAVLGSFGIAILFWTVISLLTKIEEAFNAIWHVPGVRSWARRFSDYLSVALVGPVFIFSALGVTAFVFQSEDVHRVVGIEPVWRLLWMLGSIVPYLLVCLAFAFLYAFLTNYRVRLAPALIGGVFASLAWYGVGHLFALLVAGSSKYSAMYSSMAAAVLFIIWVNIGWLIILVGAHITRYVQHRHLLAHHRDGSKIGRAHDEAIALDIMALVGHAFCFDEPKWTLESLSARGCCGSLRETQQLLQSLTEGRLLVTTNDQPEAYLPARSMETIRLEEIVAVARARGQKPKRQAEVQRVIDRIETAIATSLAGETLKELVSVGGDSPEESKVRAPSHSNSA